MTIDVDYPIILTLKEPAYDVDDVKCVLLQCGLCGFKLHDGDKFIASKLALGRMSTIVGYD